MITLKCIGFLVLSLTLSISSCFAGSIPAAMAWKYNAKCADNRASTEIVVWEHPSLPKPSKAQMKADVAEYEQFVIDKKAKKDALEAKKIADIASLGTREEIRAEAANAKSVPALRALVLKLVEIVYSNEKGTIN